MMEHLLRGFAGPVADLLEVSTLREYIARAGLGGAFGTERWKWVQGRRYRARRARRRPSELRRRCLQEAAAAGRDDTQLAMLRRQATLKFDADTASRLGGGALFSGFQDQRFRPLSHPCARSR